MEAALSPGWVYQVLLAPGGEKFECDLYKNYLYRVGHLVGHLGWVNKCLIYHLSHLLVCQDLLEHIELGLEWLGW